MGFFRCSCLIDCNPLIFGAGYKKSYKKKPSGLAMTSRFVLLNGTA